MLKILIIVRHGDYDRKGLTGSGRQQIERLSLRLAERINGSSSILLLSSPALRATQTAEILKQGLGVSQYCVHECLLSEGIVDGAQNREVMELIEVGSKDHEIIIFSTHMEMIDDFPTAWGSRRGFRICRGQQTPKGTARVIDVTTGWEEYFYS